MRCTACPDCIRATPALLSLGINLTGIFAAFIYKNPYFAIPSGVGTVSSCYFLYISIEVKNLKTFSQNNHRLKEQVSRLRNANRDLEKKLRDLSNVAEKQKANLQESKEQVGDLTKAQEKHHQLLEEQKKQLYAEQQELAALQESLDTQKDQIAHLQRINATQMTAFQKINSNLDEHGSQMQYNLDRFASILEDLSKAQEKEEELSNILKALIEQFFSNHYIQERIERLKEIRNEESELALLIAKNKATVEATNILIEEFKREVDRLKAEIDKLQGVQTGIEKDSNFYL